MFIKKQHLENLENDLAMVRESNNELFSLLKGSGTKIRRLERELLEERAAYAALQMRVDTVPHSDYVKVSRHRDRLENMYSDSQGLVVRLKHFISVQSRMIDELINE